jgi:hypothetical protein
VKQDEAYFAPSIWTNELVESPKKSDISVRSERLFQNPTVICAIYLTRMELWRPTTAFAYQEGGCYFEACAVGESSKTTPALFAPPANVVP